MWYATRYVKGQGGYTLVELIISSAIGALLLGALVSVFLTATRANSEAVGRVEASGQVRNFELFAYEDFAGSNVSDFSSGTPTQVTLTEISVANGSRYQVTYTWDQAAGMLDRQVGSNPPLHAATNVTNFQWHVDSNQTVVVTLTITVSSYTQSQTFRFYPRRNP